MTSKTAKKIVAAKASTKPARAAKGKKLALTADGRPIDAAMAKRIAAAFQAGPYMYHRACVKADVHRIYDKQGRAAAIQHAMDLGKTHGSAVSWTRNFRLGKDGNNEFEPKKHKA